jgi:hypothetical protein
MYFSRALSNGVKWYCPGVLSGPVYTPEELDVPVNAAGEPVVAEPGDEPAAKRSTLRASSLLDDDTPADAPSPPVIEQPPARKPCPVAFTDATDWRDAMIEEMGDRGFGDKAACGKHLDAVLTKRGFASYLSMPPDRREAAWNALVDGKFPTKADLSSAPQREGGGE